MSVRVRGIYSTALTDLLEDVGVVQASDAIADRFDADLPLEPAAATVETTGDRQGVGVHGDADTVATVADRLGNVGRDAFVWADETPRDAVFDGRVTDTLGRGAVVDLGVGEGFLPFNETGDRIDEGDCLRVQVRDPAPPWGDDRPLLGADLQVSGELARLVRGGRSEGGTGAADIVDLLPTDPRDGWGIRWGNPADDAEFDALDAALAAANDRAAAIDDALADAPDPDEAAPATVWAGTAGRWCWFGREARFALDDVRGGVVPTMAGHHRIKAGARSASAAVDFVETVCGTEASGAEFPFDVVTRQFGPREGDSVAIRHGKPDGRAFSLGTGAVIERDPAGAIRVERGLSPGGTLDALDVDIEAGDVAVTKLKEGRWWYPTMYRDRDGRSKGTYVNVCTPVEVFPDAARYVDLHVDVVKHADGRVERVDDDELDAAVAAGTVSEALAEKARAVAAAVADAL